MDICSFVLVDKFEFLCCYQPKVICFISVCSWTLPEIKDCLEEVGFHSVHFWVREMPDTNQNASEYRGDDDMKYEEVSTFCQRDAWNAYVVGVVRAKC